MVIVNVAHLIIEAIIIHLCILGYFEMRKFLNHLQITTEDTEQHGIF